MASAACNNERNGGACVAGMDISTFQVRDRAD